MPYNPDRKLLFVHIPKTGGSSVERFFGMNQPDRLMSGDAKHNIDGIKFASQHLRARDLENLYPDLVKKYYMFTFVRNPYDRVLSEYYYNHKKRNFNSEEFEDWFFHFYKAPWKDHKLSQTDYVYDETGYTPVQWVGKLETFEEDLWGLCKLRGSNMDLYGKKPPHDKVGSNNPTPQKAIEVFSKRHIYMINTLFRDDFVNFDYDIIE